MFSQKIKYQSTVTGASRRPTVSTIYSETYLYIKFIETSQLTIVRPHPRLIREQTGSLCYIFNIIYRKKYIFSSIYYIFRTLEKKSDLRNREKILVDSLNTNTEDKEAFEGQYCTYSCD